MKRKFEQCLFCDICFCVADVYPLAAPSVAPLQCFECTVDCDDVMNHEIETCDEEEQFCLRLKDGSELTLACAADPPREVTLDSSISISKGSLKKNMFL